MTSPLQLPDDTPILLFWGYYMLLGDGSRIWQPNHALKMSPGKQAQSNFRNGYPAFMPAPEPCMIWSY